MMITNRSNVALTNDQLARVAPAIFASAPHASMSSRYSFVKTIDVIEALRGAGWAPVAAQVGKARDLSRIGVQRHVVRLRHPDVRLDVGGLFPELVLVNSHDGASAYQLHAGLFRLVCGNGLVIADATFAKVSIKHTGVSAAQVVDASFEVVKEVPRLGQSVEQMRAVQLTEMEQNVFASAAARLRWNENEIPVQPAGLLQARRYDDRGADLWNTFNRVQENLSQGGVRGRSTTGRRMSTRGIASVTEDTKINKALWHLAEEMRRLKTA